MARNYSVKVIKQLYADSNNRCAFPGCEEKLFENGRHIGKICHIEGYSENGPRYNPDLGDKVNDYDNLLLLCGNHHDEIDQKAGDYPVAALRKMKAEHIASMQDLLKKQASQCWLSALPQFMDEEIIGRDQSLQQLRDSLNQNKIQAVVSVSGLGGIGKTTLAKAYIKEYAADYAHIIWVSKTGQNILHNLADEPNLIAALGLVETFKNPNLSYEQRLAYLKTKLEQKAGTKKLLVLDNVDKELDEAEELARLPQANGWQLLVTSRRQSPCLPNRLQLDVLSPEDAAQLFCRHYPDAKTDPHLNELLEHIGRHTLTTELLAKLMAKKAQTIAINCAQLLNKLEEHKLNDSSLQKTLAAKGYTKKEQSLFEHLMASFDIDELDNKERDSWEIWWLKHFCVLPAQAFTYEDLYYLLSINQHENSNPIEEALSKLVQTGWIKLYQKEGKPFYECHRLLQEVLLHKTKLGWDDNSDLEAYIWNIRNLLKVDQSKEHWIDKKPFLPFADRLYELLSDMHSIAFARFLNEYAMFIQNAYGNYQKAALIYEKSLAILLVDEGEEGKNVATSLSNLATVYGNLGRYKEAAELLEKALKSDIANFGEQHPTVAIRQSNLAVVFKHLGRNNEAAELLEKALESALVNFGEEHPTVATRQSNLALVYRNLGRHKEAAELLEKALESDIVHFGLFHPLPATRLNNLFIPYLNLNQLPQASACSMIALSILLKCLGVNHPHTKAALGRFVVFIQQLPNVKPDFAFLANLLGIEEAEVVASLQPLFQFLEGGNG